MSMPLLRYVWRETNNIFSHFVFCDQKAVIWGGLELVQSHPTIPSNLVQLDLLSTSAYNWS